tara:strand:- start:149 stop:415 length:267 start_codon:yes stop_codon:yes gene_type:complete
MAKSRTQEYYDSNPEANRRRLKYQKEYDSKPSQRKKRSKLNKANRRRGTYGNGDKLDISHTGSGLILKHQSKNRGDKNDTAGDRKARG